MSQCPSAPGWEGNEERVKQWRFGLLLFEGYKKVLWKFWVIKKNNEWKRKPLECSWMNQWMSENLKLQNLAIKFGSFLLQYPNNPLW
jgi:hypothetical protein